MDVYQIVEALGGEIVSNKAKVKFKGDWVIIGAVMGGAMTPTAECEEVAASLEAAPTEVKPEKPGKKGGKKAAEPAFVPGEDLVEGLGDIDFPE